MRINIIYQDDKIIVDSTKKYVNLDEIFSMLRDKYAIENDKRLILLSENVIYKEGEYNPYNLLESNLSKSNVKEEFVLLCFEDYRKHEIRKEFNKGDSKYSIENMIMKVTGASNPICPDKKMKARGKQLRKIFLNNIVISNVIGYPRYDILSNLEEDLQSDESSSGNLEGGILHRYSIPSFLGRIRERDSNQPAELSMWATSSVIREEDINRLVNEMGFPDNSVRIALRMTRNNMNRAVDLLLSNPEVLNEEIFQSNRPAQGLQDILNRNQTSSAQINNSSLENNSDNNNNSNQNRTQILRRNYNERNLAESTFNLQIPVLSSNVSRVSNEINNQSQQNNSINQGINQISNINDTQIISEIIGTDLNDVFGGFQELNNDSSNFMSADSLIPGNNNNNSNENNEIIFSPLVEYFQEDIEEEESSLDDNFNLNQEEDEEMEYEHSIQSDENSNEFV